MSTLQIYGASDDLAEFEGHVSGEIGCYDAPVIVLIGRANTGLGVILEHNGERGWQLGTFMPDDVDEDHWLPPTVQITNKRYSPLLTVELPDGTPVRAFIDGEEKEIS